MSKELIYKIALTKLPTVGAVTAKHLVSYCGGFEAVFETKKRVLLKIPGVGETAVRAIKKASVLQAAEAEVRFIEDQGIQVHSYLDISYPARLKKHMDCPVLLYMKGKANLNHRRMLAIVGTRRPTEHGRLFCEELVKSLQSYSVSIISGLAYGIDITAHKQCLQESIETIGVLAHGLDRIYPAVHRDAAIRMCEKGGILTEFSSGVLPDRENFPKRNRIVAGMCDALIVVETPEKGGSMISVDLANGYKKDVFAVPGRVKDPASKGCNFLIKTHRASLLEGVDDLVRVLGWEKGKERGIQKQLFVDLSEVESKIVSLLEEAPLNVDKLVFGTKISISRLSGLLLGLEFKGLVKSLPGNRYMLIK